MLLQPFFLKEASYRSSNVGKDHLVLVITDFFRSHHGFLARSSRKYGAYKFAHRVTFHGGIRQVLSITHTF